MDTMVIEVQGRQEVTEFVVACPFCGSRVFGHDGDDLPNSLHDHIEDAHDIRPSRLVPRLKY